MRELERQERPMRIDWAAHIVPDDADWEPTPELMDVGLGEFLSVRTAGRLLEHHGIRTVGDLVRLPIYQVCSIKGVGTKSLVEVMQFCHSAAVRASAIRTFGDIPSAPD